MKIAHIAALLASANGLQMNLTAHTKYQSQEDCDQLTQSDFYSYVFN